MTSDCRIMNGVMPRRGTKCLGEVNNSLNRDLTNRRAYVSKRFCSLFNKLADGISGTSRTFSYAILVTLLDLDYLVDPKDDVS